MSLERTPSLILVDRDARRRAAISHALSLCQIHVEPLETIAELSRTWPRSSVILIHDEGTAIVELIEAMANHGKWFPVIAFGEKPTAQRIVQAVLDGAADYIVWPVAADELGAAVAGSMGRAGRASHAKLREVTAQARLKRLTRRERQVLDGIASGLSNRLIAQELAISPRTVEIHRAHLLTKLGASRTSDAIRIAIEATLVR